MAIELFQIERQFSTTIYCDITGVKQGYMYLNQGTVAPEKAFGQGILMALGILLKSYSDRSLLLAFPEGYLTTIIQPQMREEVYAVFKKFASFQFITERHNDLLDIVNQMGHIDAIKQGSLHGYTKEQVETRKNNLAEEVKAKKKLNMPPDYQEVFLPPRGVVIDFETNSPHVKFARIFEVGAVKFENGIIIDRFQSYTNPGIKIPKSIRTLTGIKQSDIDSAPKTYIVMKQLLQFIGDTPTLVGHNLHTYDYELLRLFLDRFNLPHWKGNLLCTKKLARKIQLVVSDYKLSTLCQLFRISNNSAHRAQSDCEATFELLIALYNHTLLGKLKTEQGSLEFEEVLNLIQ
ncbi:PolC-type DNA polymerase III [Paenibacillus periandrae]|uniref:3'-5' exonuclease n=1 Tax=Paenibacillus periandrae TaxID=1761741 RepID=UPI001F09989A|nr:3'-5' exonuclease [Paenibacillus periandrae]